MIFLPSDVDLCPFTPSRFVLIIDGETVTLEEWQLDRDYDQWLKSLERY